CLALILLTYATYLSLLLLHCSRAQLDLYSFPTRRSSDLPNNKTANNVNHKEALGSLFPFSSPFIRETNLFVRRTNVTKTEITKNSYVKDRNVINSAIVGK